MKQSLFDITVRFRVHEENLSISTAEQRGIATNNVRLIAKQYLSLGYFKMYPERKLRQMAADRYKIL